MSMENKINDSRKEIINDGKVKDFIVPVDSQLHDDKTENFIDENQQIEEVRNDIIKKFEGEKKEVKKHPTDEQLLDQIIEAIKELRMLPEGNNWNKYSFVSKRDFHKRNAFIAHFKSFNNAVDMALKRAEEKDLKIYYRKKI